MILLILQALVLVLAFTSTISLAIAIAPASNLSRITTHLWIVSTLWGLFYFLFNLKEVIQ